METKLRLCLLDQHLPLRLPALVCPVPGAQPDLFLGRHPGRRQRRLPHLLISMVLFGAGLLPAGAAFAGKAPAAPRSVSGIVSQVIDGNSVRLSPPDQPTLVVRLLGVDAPELCQVGGNQAQQALASWALHQTGTLRIQGRDREGRTVGTLTVGGLDLNRHIVEEGLAFSVRGRNGHGPLMKQERMARALARGLHARPGALLPADFRRVHGPCGAP